jgi:hypothetical protein
MDFRAEVCKFIGIKLGQEFDLSIPEMLNFEKTFKEFTKIRNAALDEAAQICNEQLRNLDDHESETGGMEEVLTCFNNILSLKSGATEDKRPLKKNPSLGPGQEWHG